jgi:hypothetical protein
LSQPGQSCRFSHPADFFPPGALGFVIERDLLAQGLKQTGGGQAASSGAKDEKGRVVEEE